jgi:small GTP-binding protein
MSSSKEEEEDGIKVILVGESGTGKTSLINSAQGKQFIEGNQISSMTCSFIKVKITISGEKYLINLWDTIGQEQFRSLTKIFLNNAKIVIFVFDITDNDSFEALDFWYETIENELGKEPIKGIAANKQDLFEEQKVDDDLIEEYAKKKGIKFVYTTATNPMSFNGLLEDLLKEYLEKSGIGANPEQKKNKNKGKKLKKDNHNDDPNNPNNKKKRKKCC